MYAGLTILAFLFVTAMWAAAIWFAWQAITGARTPQGALGWVVFLLAAPLMAVPLFVFLGHHRYDRYVSARRDSEDVAARINDFAKRHAPARPPAIPARAFEAISAMPLTGGNDMRLLVNGRETFPAMLAAIDAAQNYVLVHFYIVRDDATGRALHERLVNAAARGVTVRFFCDPVGSHALPASFRETLRDAGAHVGNPRRMRGARNRFQLNFRNHRKMVIVDGKIGFTGGLNLGDEYQGQNPDFGDWRDTNVELRGPIVTQMQLVFAEDWHWATDEDIIGTLDWEPEIAPADMTGLIVATGPGDRLESGALFFFAALTRAQRRIWIASPYFVPDRDVLTALQYAALQGVDVRLLLPEVIDHLIPWLAAFAYFDEVRAAGVEIWRYQNDFMHQKVVLVDDDFAAVGTTNLDNRSFRLNFEAMAVFFDPRAASATEAMLKADFERATRLTTPLADHPARIRYGAPVARLFAPIL